MIRIYLNKYLKTLWKNKSENALNILGLAVGITCFSLIYIWIEDELTYNHNFSNLPNLYIVKDQQSYNGITYTFDATPGPLAESISREIAGIKYTARVQGSVVLIGQDENVRYSKGLYVDDSFLKMFSVKGERSSKVLSFIHEKEIILSKSLSENIFGKSNSLGLYVLINKEKYLVSGVMEDFPDNSSIQAAWLMPFKNFERGNTWLKEWSTNSVITYVELIQDAPVNLINKVLYGFVQTKDPNLKAKMSIYPLSRLRLYNNFDESGREIEGSSLKYIESFSIIAWIILFMGCINFINLSTARSEKKYKEIGIRKVLGASKSQLVGKYLVEAMMLSFISTLFAIVLILMLLPLFNEITQKNISLDIFRPSHLGFLVLSIFICGLFSGSFPAFYLSSFKPTKILNGLKIHGRDSEWIRKILVVMQFSVALVLIICTIVVYQQIRFVKSREIGYSKENLIYTTLPSNLFELTRNRLLQTGVVKNAGMSNNSVVELSTNTGDINWSNRDPNRKVLITVEGIESHYLPTLGIKFLEGRNFKADLRSDSSSVIINKTFAEIIGKRNVMGSELVGFGQRFKIIGIIDDFLYNDFYKPIQPLILFANPSTYVLTIRLNVNNDLKSSIGKVEQIIKEINPGYPFEYKFVDEQFNKYFDSEVRLQKLSVIFTVMSILISCIGLFGLSSYSAERRTKEIGIRKVIGASTGSLATLLSKEYFMLIIISCLISFPVAWYFIHNWLLNYSYRTPIYWWVFAFSSIGAVILTLVTISYQTIRAAIKNPVHSLRLE
jgi:putative ABC transport system permease protein